MTALRARCCLGAVLFSAAALSADFGDPLPGLSDADRTRFENGKTEFVAVEAVDEGLGPVFNEASCATCHVGPGTAIGGTTQRLETRFGRLNPDGSFDPLAQFGGSLLQDPSSGWMLPCTAAARKFAISSRRSVDGRASFASRSG